jgi:hypothetical protein
MTAIIAVLGLIIGGFLWNRVSSQGEPEGRAVQAQAPERSSGQVSFEALELPDAPEQGGGILFTLGEQEKSITKIVALLPDATTWFRVEAVGEWKLQIREIPQDAKFMLESGGELVPWDWKKFDLPEGVRRFGLKSPSGGDADMRLIRK